MSRRYFILTIILLIIEVLIALFVRDKFIRPYLGDVLVVILIYCFIMIFWNKRKMTVVAGVFIFACFIELLQYFDFISRVGLNHSAFARTVIGHSAGWGDILAYAAGCIIIIALEIFRKGDKEAIAR